MKNKSLFIFAGLILLACILPSLFHIMFNIGIVVAIYAIVKIVLAINKIKK